MIRGLCDCQVNTINDIKIGDSKAYAYKYESIASLLSRWKNMKKDIHSKHCHNQRKHFFLFGLSVSIMLGSKALVVIYQLSRVMAEKREKPLL